MTKVSPQEIIRSKHKWYLGGGKEVLWAPDFPNHLDSPGFWDNACYLEWRVDPLYTLTILDENLREIPLKLKSRDWIPSKLTQTYVPVGGLSVTEEKCLLPNDVMLSQLTVKNTSSKKRSLILVMWTYNRCGKKNVPGPYRTNYQMKNNVFSNEIIQYDQKGEDVYNIFFSMASKEKSRSYAVNSSEKVAALKARPEWLLTPAYERMTEKGLDNSFIISSGERKDCANTCVYAAIEVPVTIKPGASKTITTACTLANSIEKSRRQLSDGLSLTNPMKVSYENWENFFNQVPAFECSDKYLSKYYWYRWYGLKLNVGIVDHKNTPYPFIYEGINAGWFRQHISYSAQCHMLETRWMHSPELARGSILNFVHTQRKDGSYLGAISNRKNRKGAVMYHAHWGYCIRRFCESHPDKKFLKTIYPSLERYIRYFDRVRDRENSNLYDIADQVETGQEYMSRYFFVDKKADQWGEFTPHIKGVDLTVYLYELVRTMAWMARKLGQGENTVAKWERKADKIKEAVLNKMWNSRTKMFCDVHPKTMRKSPVKSAVSFYPFMTDIPSKKHLPAITAHLLNPREFWTKYPVVSTSMDDSMFSAYGEWKGERKHCTWAGRSWLMTNSHIAEALANAAESLDPGLEKFAVELIMKFFRMTFIDGDIDRPTSYEYYNPFNGRAPFFRGVDDYMHSWMNELILKYVCGIRTSDGNTVTIKPLDFKLTRFTLDNLILRGKTIKITWRKTRNHKSPQGLTIYINNKKTHHSPTLEQIQLKL